MVRWTDLDSKLPKTTHLKSLVESDAQTDGEITSALLIRLQSALGSLSGSYRVKADKKIKSLAADDLRKAFTVLIGLDGNAFKVGDRRTEAMDILNLHCVESTWRHSREPPLMRILAGQLLASVEDRSGINEYIQLIDDVWFNESGDITALSNLHTDRMLWPEHRIHVGELFFDEHLPDDAIGIVGVNCELAEVMHDGFHWDIQARLPDSAKGSIIQYGIEVTIDRSKTARRTRLDPDLWTYTFEGGQQEYRLTVHFHPDAQPDAIWRLDPHSDSRYPPNGTDLDVTADSTVVGEWLDVPEGHTVGFAWRWPQRLLGEDVVPTYWEWE